jgi:hypothetical protein
MYGIHISNLVIALRNNFSSIESSMAPTNERSNGYAGTLVEILRPDASDVVVMNTIVVSTTLCLERASFRRTRFIWKIREKNLGHLT